MRIHYLYMQFKYILLALLLAGATSCNDDILINAPGSGEMGTAVPVKILFNAPEAPSVSSRAVDEFAVENLYVFVFNTSGQLIFKHLYDRNELITDPNAQGDVKQEGKNYVTAELPTGKAYIYAFANAINNETYSITGDLDEYNIGDNCMNNFLKLKVEIDNGHRDLQRNGTSLLMSGTCFDNEEDGTYTIEDGKDIKTLKLKRIDSQITFNITADSGSGSKCTSFKAKRWYIENAPVYSYLTMQDEDASSNSAQDYFTTFAENENDLKRIENNSFTFFMPENRKKAKNSISAYAARELQNKNADGTNGAFTNAPEYGTYVVIKGSYEGTAYTTEYSGTGSPATVPVTAEVTYKIHLGYVNNRATDFSNNRNTKYTYNVKVRGVDDIVLEVESRSADTPTEKAPGATGEVIFTSGTRVFNLDAHYEQVLLTFNKDELAKIQSSDGFSCMVRTPFTGGNIVKNIDLDWVKVMKNPDGSKIFQPYPGNGSSELQSVSAMLDQLYKETHPEKDQSEEITNPYFVGHNKNISFTCFINEFYYDEVPSGSSISVTDKSTLWKYFVNQPNRTMYIVCHRDPSKDGESSAISAEYVISQRAIQTFYDTDVANTGLSTAYGLETINETGMLDWGGQYGAAPKDYNDGWKNTKNLLKGQTGWSTIVDIPNNGYSNVDKNQKVNQGADDTFILNNLGGYESDAAKEYYMNGMKTSYQRAYIACMQRNRDLNGDGEINKNEIRWYLPAINQYESMYVGEAELSTESRLYYYPKEYDYKKNFKHYASSTVDTYDNPQILWSEEAVSTSTLNQRHSFRKDVKYFDIDGWLSNKLHYRCVRNLGTISENYQNYIEYDKETQTITIPYLKKDINSIRTSVTGELGKHSYKPGEENNKLYPKFQVNMVAHPASKLRKSIGIDNALTGCESLKSDTNHKWRAPNLRELTLMGILTKNGNSILTGQDVCRTAFGYDTYRRGWFWIGYINMQSFTYDAGTNIRCVRDVD